jgi:hypothetical protein
VEPKAAWLRALVDFENRYLILLVVAAVPWFVARLRTKSLSLTERNSSVAFVACAAGYVIGWLVIAGPALLNWLRRAVS